MNSRRILIVFTSIALIAAAWVALRAARSKHASETMLATLASRQSELSAQLQRWEAAYAAAKKEDDSRALNPALTSPPSVHVTPVESAAQTPPPASSWVEWMKDPKVQTLYFAKARAELALSHGPFFQAQGLTESQIEKLSDVLINHLADTEDLRAIRQERDASFSDPSFTAQRERQLAELRAAEIEVLGVADYEQLKNYERSIPARKYIAKVAGTAALEGEPLSRQQADQLTVLIANTNAVYAAGGPMNFNQIDWKAAEAQAQTILSPGQFKHFRFPASGIGPSRGNNELSKAVLKAATAMWGWPAPAPGGGQTATPQSPGGR